MNRPSRSGGEGVGTTLFDKIWDAHVVQQVDDGPTQLYIDRLYCHEVTSPQAFEGMRSRGLKCFRPKQIVLRTIRTNPSKTRYRRHRWTH